MNNPRVTAAISLVGVVIIGSSILFHGPESPSPLVATLQWIFLAGAVIGLVGSLIQIANGR